MSSYQDPAQPLTGAPPSGTLLYIPSYHSREVEPHLYLDQRLVGNSTGELKRVLVRGREQCGARRLAEATCATGATLLAPDGITYDKRANRQCCTLFRDGAKLGREKPREALMAKTPEGRHRLSLVLTSERCVKPCSPFSIFEKNVDIFSPRFVQSELTGCNFPSARFMSYTGEHQGITM